MTLKPPRWRQRLAPRWLLHALLARRGAVLMHLGRERRHDLEIVRETRRQVPLLLDDAAALHIQSCVRAARRLGGLMAEAGVLMGGSARLICEAKEDTPLHLFDVFETLQSSSAPRSAGETEIRAHFGAVHGNRTQVEKLLGSYREVELHPGVFPETAQMLKTARFSFVHIDMDLPSSTRQALTFFHPRLMPGGIIIGDDYNDPGVRDSFAAYFEPLDDTLIELPWRQIMVVKQRGPSGIPA